MPSSEGQLRWRCRRGMRELDRIFERHLDHRWARESDAQRAVFLRLLDCEDDTLWRWVVGDEPCSDVELAGCIQRLREIPG